VWGAFWELHTSRGMGATAPGGIPFTAVDRYAARFPEVGDFRRFWRLVLAMDAVYLEHATRDRGKENGGSGS
jgi:hypothetical protein